MISLFLAGDVMTGRGIDQVLPHPADPRLYESYVKSAHDYVELAERANGPIAKPLTFSAIWGDALSELERKRPDARIVNLETAVTQSTEPEPKGINYKMSPANVGAITAAGIDCCVLARQPGDIVVLSIHWGPNWGYDIPDEQVAFARRLIESGAVDVIHGHSSHHVKGIEVYRQKLILYGCGDFIDDYEGITGYEEFRDDLVLMYFPVVRAADRTLAGLDMVPLQIRGMRLHRASPADARWLADTLNRAGKRFGTCISIEPDHVLKLVRA